MEPIFEAVLANDPSRITPAAAAQRMDEDVLVTDVHWLYRGDTPLHLAAAALHYACDPRPLSPTWNPAAQQRIIELLVTAGATVDLPDRGGVTPLHRAVRARSPAASSSSRSSGCSSPPARPWPTWTATALPSPTGSRARPCAARWRPDDLSAERPKRTLSATRMRG